MAIPKVSPVKKKVPAELRMAKALANGKLGKMLSVIGMLNVEAEMLKLNSGQASPEVFDLLEKMINEETEKALQNPAMLEKMQAEFKLGTNAKTFADVGGKVQMAGGSVGAPPEKGAGAVSFSAADAVMKQQEGALKELAILKKNAGEGKKIELKGSPVSYDKVNEKPKEVTGIGSIDPAKIEELKYSDVKTMTLNEKRAVLKSVGISTSGSEPELERKLKTWQDVERPERVAPAAPVAPAAAPVAPVKPVTEASKLSDEAVKKAEFEAKLAAKRAARTGAPAPTVVAAPTGNTPISNLPPASPNMDAKIENIKLGRAEEARALLNQRAAKKAAKAAPVVQAPVTAAPAAQTSVAAAANKVAAVAPVAAKGKAATKPMVQVLDGMFGLKADQSRTKLLAVSIARIKASDLDPKDKATLLKQTFEKVRERGQMFNIEDAGNIKKTVDTVLEDTNKANLLTTTIKRSRSEKAKKLLTKRAQLKAAKVNPVPTPAAATGAAAAVAAATGVPVLPAAPAAAAASSAAAGGAVPPAGGGGGGGMGPRGGIPGYGGAAGGGGGLGGKVGRMFGSKAGNVVSKLTGMGSRLLPILGVAGNVAAAAWLIGELLDAGKETEQKRKTVGLLSGPGIDLDTTIASESNLDRALTEREKAQRMASYEMMRMGSQDQAILERIAGTRMNAAMRMSQQTMPSPAELIAAMRGME